MMDFEMRCERSMRKHSAQASEKGQNCLREQEAFRQLSVLELEGQKSQTGESGWRPEGQGKQYPGHPFVFDCLTYKSQFQPLCLLNGKQEVDCNMTSEMRPLNTVLSYHSVTRKLTKMDQKIVQEIIILFYPILATSF